MMIKLTLEEARLVRKYAESHSLSMEEVFKQALFEKIEDEYDSAIFDVSYADYINSGKKSAPIEDLWKACGI